MLKDINAEKSGGFEGCWYRGFGIVAWAVGVKDGRASDVYSRVRRGGGNISERFDLCLCAQT